MEAVFIRLNALNVLKSGKVIHLFIHFGYSFAITKRNVLIAYSFGYSFLCLFYSNKTGKYLFYLVFIGFIYCRVNCI